MDADKIGQFCRQQAQGTRTTRPNYTVNKTKNTRAAKRRQSYARLENISHQRKFQHTFSDPNHLILILLVKTQLKWWIGEWWGSKRGCPVVGYKKINSESDPWRGKLEKIHLMIISFLIRKFVFKRRSHFYLVRKCFNYIVSKGINCGYPSLSTIAILL